MPVVFPTPEEQDPRKIAAENKRQATRKKRREERRLASPPRGIERQCERLINGETRCPETFRVVTEKNPKRYCSQNCKWSAAKQRRTKERRRETLGRIGWEE